MVERKDSLMRLRDILKIIHISPASWWRGVRSGKFPKPLKLGPRMTTWKAAEIYALADDGVVAPSEKP